MADARRVTLDVWRNWYPWSGERGGYATRADARAAGERDGDLYQSARWEAVDLSGEVVYEGRSRAEIEWCLQANAELALREGRIYGLRYR